MAPPTPERLHRKCCVCVRCSGRLESGVLVVFYLDRPSVVLRRNVAKEELGEHPRSCRLIPMSRAARLVGPHSRSSLLSPAKAPQPLLALCKGYSAP
ncbi:hypothetical protein E2C01_007125 [Portunus trituberculatus]|uniref:Uncharacterized protein n=1 Tax=Portunus trituberculatus TaxID=210409 RepID=A0A5B7CZM7_PORTR|nr:hypothetical protein [Portunus trituberculatus]